jgi:SAM-dependent methyltransferase
LTSQADNSGGQDRPPDPIAASVVAYSEHAADSERAPAMKMFDTVERFAATLPSLILDAGCGPGRDLARFIARDVDLKFQPGRVRRGVGHPAWLTSPEGSDTVDNSVVTPM